jgi:hypothetical protein
MVAGERTTYIGGFGSVIVHVNFVCLFLCFGYFQQTQSNWRGRETEITVPSCLLFFFFTNHLLPFVSGENQNELTSMKVLNKLI